MASPSKKTVSIRKRKKKMSGKGRKRDLRSAVAKANAARVDVL